MCTFGPQVEEQYDAKRLSIFFVHDVRQNWIRSHVHECKDTCFKYDKKSNSFSSCRFGYHHTYKSIAYKRTHKERRFCRLKGRGKCYNHPNCPVQPLLEYTHRESWRRQADGANVVRLRRGQKLVPPQVLMVDAKQGGFVSLLFKQLE